MPRYVSVYPLVSTRALARPFTYEATNGVRKGSVVSIRLAGAKKRGVVVALDDEPPEGVDPAPVERVLETVPEQLVDLALWIADYYGSTPGRALELVAPLRREPRAAAQALLEREGLEGEPRPAALTASQQAALERIVAGLDDAGGRLLLYGATGSGKTEVYLRACEAALERGRGAVRCVARAAQRQAANRRRCALGHLCAADECRRDHRR